ncbi:tetratricopeptide repeat protein [Litorilituus lipolyticus]|nr:hypothetical protein [Litorilituus lipolyticus]
MHFIQIKKLTNYIHHHKSWIITAIVSSLVCFALLKPQAFMDLWLTKDQQGQLLFHQGKYNQASKTFVDNRWQAYSAYGAQEYKTSATLYGQFTEKEDLLAQANALAHGREYIKARDLYQSIIQTFPNYTAAQKNIAIVQDIIDEINLLSANQQAEQGESSKDLGDEPQTADGAERQDGPPQELEQLTAEQLLLDDNLNEMWLRQVQKNPARFLSHKFYLQLSSTKKATISDADESTAND